MINVFNHRPWICQLFIANCKLIPEVFFTYNEEYSDFVTSWQ